MLCHFAHYVLFSKANTLFAHTALFEWSRSIVSSVSYKTKQFANEVCFWTHIKRAKTNFFCYKRYVVSVLSPLASKSYGGSHLVHRNIEAAQNFFFSLTMISAVEVHK